MIRRWAIVGPCSTPITDVTMSLPEKSDKAGDQQLRQTGQDMRHKTLTSGIFSEFLISLKRQKNFKRQLQNFFDY